jgi:MobA/VirD2-like, nuclease domain
VIPRIHKGGHRTYGLVWYLYGPGKQEEHLDPHLVAAWDTAMARDPGRDPDATIKALAVVLDIPVTALGERAPGKHVWHASIRTAPGDPDLPDHAWANIARRMVAAAGFDTADDAGCRWIAIRHATDHIHLVVTRARQDGRIPNHHNDALRMRKAAIDLEHRYQLQSTAPADHTAAPHPAGVSSAKPGGSAGPNPRASNSNRSFAASPPAAQATRSSSAGSARLGSTCSPASTSTARSSATRSPSPATIAPTDAPSPTQAAGSPPT